MDFQGKVHQLGSKHIRVRFNFSIEGLQQHPTLWQVLLHPEEETAVLGLARTGITTTVSWAVGRGSLSEMHCLTKKHDVVMFRY